MLQLSSKANHYQEEEMADITTLKTPTCKPR
jgi:hypothetical protein